MKSNLQNNFPNRLQESTIQITTIVSIQPRLLRRENAAVYMGVSTSYFDELVAVGKFPKAKSVSGTVKSWDRLELDRTVDELTASQNGGWKKGA
jgi:prophage regulatory protein